MHQVKIFKDDKNNTNYNKKKFWLYFGKIENCSHEIKRRLLLGRKAMTNIDTILKSRDITLPTKVHLVKAIVFPVVMYGCESWMIKKAERQKLVLLNCGVGKDS